jgi:hypothetical protein
MMNRGNMGKQVTTPGMMRMAKPMPQVMKKGGAVKGYAKGGMAGRGDGCCMKGKTKGTMK